MSDWIRKAKRVRIYERDAWRCVWCRSAVSAESASLDHVQPRCMGGTNHADNLVTSCLDCNKTRGQLSAAQWARTMAVRRGERAQSIRARVAAAVRAPLAA